MGTLYREEGEEESRSLFHPPRRAPTEQEEKVVLAQVLHIAIMAVLTTYSYQWNSEVRLLDEGAPIGLELAGALARVTMLWWDKHFLKLIHSNAITLYLYKRYIDVQNMAGKPLPPGTRWQARPWASRLGRMVVVDAEVEVDKLVPADMRTMVELRKMADSLYFSSSNAALVGICFLGEHGVALLYHGAPGRSARRAPSLLAILAAPVRRLPERRSPWASPAVSPQQSYFCKMAAVL